MNKRQFNKLKMSQAVIVVFDLFAAFIATVPALVESVAKFKNLVMAILLKADLQESAPAGKITARDNTRTDLIQSLFIVMKGIKLHSRTTKDAELFALSDFSKSELDELPDLRLESTARSMKEKAAACAEALPHYGVAPEKLVKLNQDYDAFAAALADLSGGAAGQIAATTTLVDLYKQVSQLLETLDDLVDIADDTNADFGLQYRAAREIKDLPATHQTKKSEEKNQDGTPKNPGA
jgi:hypothetical protein